MEIKMHKKKNSLPPCLIFNIRKPQTALKLISKQRKPLGCVKPQYRSFCKIAQKIEQNRITANPYAPFSTILASFSTAMLPLLHIEFQENHRERRGRERERERATLELELARNRPEPSVPIRKKISGTQGGVYLWFSTRFFLCHANLLSLCCVIIQQRGYCVTIQGIV